MARDAKTTDEYADCEMMLDCPVCDFYDVVYYARKPPTYCSDACKQKAYRQRKQKRNGRDVTILDDINPRYGKLSPLQRELVNRYIDTLLAQQLNFQSSSYKLPT